MSDKERLELFNRYYRGTNTKEKPEGSGLGLAIVKNIIEKHNGYIYVKDNDPQGSVFVVGFDREK